MRAFSSIVLLTSALAFASCASAPRKYLTPPSTVPVRQAVLNVQEAIDRAKTHAHELAADKTFTPAQSAEIKEVEQDIDEASEATTKIDKPLVALDSQIAAQTTTANSAIDAEIAAKAKAARYAKWRNRFLLIALALVVFIFRKPLLSVAKWAIKQLPKLLLLCGL